MYWMLWCKQFRDNMTEKFSRVCLNFYVCVKCIQCSASMDNETLRRTWNIFCIKPDVSMNQPGTFQHHITCYNFQNILEYFHDFNMVFFISLNLNFKVTKAEDLKYNWHTSSQVWHTRSSTISINLACRHGSTLNLRSSRSLDLPILSSISSTMPEITLWINA